MGLGQVGVRLQGPLGLLFPRAGTLGVTPRCLGVEGPGPATGLGVGRRSRSSCVWTVLTTEIQGLAPQTFLGTGLLSGFSSSISCLTEPFAVLPTPILRKAVSPRLSGDYSGSVSDLGDYAGCAPRVCSYLNCSEKWSLVLLVKLMSFGKRPELDVTFGPGYHNLKFG